MKILITTDCYTPMINGVVTSIRNLETQLRSRGHEVKILCPSQYLHGESRDNIVRIGSIGAGKFCNGARAAVCFRKSSLQKLIDWKPDVIHAQSEFFSFAMAKRMASLFIDATISSVTMPGPDTPTKTSAPLMASSRLPVMCS